MAIPPIALMFSAVEEKVQRLLQNSSWESGDLCAVHLGAAEWPHLPVAESFCDTVLFSAAYIVAVGPQVQPPGKNNCVCYICGSIHVSISSAFLRHVLAAR